MPKKLNPHPFAFAGPFDKAGYVHHNKRIEITVFHNTQMWLQCGKRIISNLGPGGGQFGKECGLAGIWKTHKAHISQKFKFQFIDKFFTRFPGF